VPAVTAPSSIQVQAPAAPTVQADGVKNRVLALVAEKTGYPQDMLDLDLDLEADLGVDTVKQAEVFAAIREAYGITRDDKIKLRDFPTLAHVIRFVYERRPELAGVAQAPSPVQPPSKLQYRPPLNRLHNLPRPHPVQPQVSPTPSASGSWLWWSRRPVIPKTCSTWISIWKPTSGSTP
jgi:acyl carrier protein